MKIFEQVSSRCLMIRKLESQFATIFGQKSVIKLERTPFFSSQIFLIYLKKRDGTMVTMVDIDMYPELFIVGLTRKSCYFCVKKELFHKL